VALQLAEVVEGLGARQFAGMDQAHERSPTSEPCSVR
jgi:hypothetical protein